MRAPEDSGPSFPTPRVHITAAETQPSQNKADVPAQVLDTEARIAHEQARLDPKNSGKPQQWLDTIVEDRLSKFFKKPADESKPFVQTRDITVGGPLLLHEAEYRG